MNVTLTKQPKNVAELTIEVTPAEYQPHLERAAGLLSERRTVPGFRPGKVPFAVLAKSLGADAILQEAAQLIVRATYPKAVEQEGLETVGPPNIALQKIAMHNPFVYKATVPLLPEVTLGDYRTLHVERKPVSVDDSEIDKVIDELRRSRGAEARVDRAARSGDKVEIDFAGFLDKVPVENATAKHQHLLLGSGHFVPGFEDSVVGMQAGEEKEFTVRFPEDYAGKQLAGRDVVFKVKVHSVFEITLPEVNDDFAKSVLGEGTVQDLRERLGKNIREDKERKERERFEVAMLEKIIETSTIGELPDQVVDAEVAKMVHELEHSVGDQGMEFAKYLESIKKTADDLKQEFRPQAERRLKTALIIRNVAEQEHIAVSDDEVTKEIDAMAAVYQGNAEIEKNLRSAEYFSYTKNMLTSRRVTEFLDGLIGTAKE